MAGGNAIGTGAVVLTANADRLVDGLAKAEAKAVGWAGRVGGKVGGLLGKVKGLFGGAKGGGGEGGAAGGGLLGGLLFGTGIGAGVAVALGGLAAVKGGADKVIDSLANIGEVAKKYQNVGTDRRAGVDRAARGMDRIAAVFDEFMLNAAVKLAPAIEMVAAVLERIGAVASTVFGDVVDEIEKVGAGFGLWVAGADRAGEAGGAASRVIWDGLRQTSGVLALAADLTVGLGGSFVYTAGVALKGLSAIVGGLADVCDWLSEATGRAVKLGPLLGALAGGAGGFLVGGPFGALVGAVGGGFLGDQLLDGLDAGKVKEKLDRIGDGMKTLGKLGIDAFGKMGPWVDAVFDKAEKGFSETERLTKMQGAALAGAMGRGSTEAYSVMAKFQAGNILTGQASADNPVKIAKEQLKEAKDLKRIIYKWVSDQRAFQGTVVRVIP